ncbi:MAG: DUF4982 domain-containing protein [Prevotella sp.]|nr:DUF4982 domain-containing protein [Prevotella sp.]
MRNFREPRNIEGVSAPQHGSFLSLTKEEYDRLQAWSDDYCQTTTSKPRKEITLADGWQFSRDRLSWQTVSVPHDWAISGPFDKKWDLQTVAIEQNGEKEATEKSGRSGALPWIGKGYYKRNIFIPTGFNGAAELVFDGAMAEPVVKVNGREAGSWAYGYNTFRVDITKQIKTGDNLVEVDLQNLEESSRWYPGAGIYRPVTLVLTGKQHLDRWGVYFRTLSIDAGKADVEVTAKGTGGGAIEVTLLDDNGQVVAAAHNDIDNSGSTCTTMEITQPLLWTPEQPQLYTLRVQQMVGGTVIDELTERVGIRTVSVSKEDGFQLNGQTRKLHGVCLHHDLGPLGAAVNKAALIRQIKILKDMGCDAIRTAHNMPSQMQMQVCDSLGMMVMAESFDMWIYPKCKNGYSRFFKDWSDRDMENLVLANRNHPSVVMWSIGNEIPEQGDKKAVDIIKRLQGICHKLDPSRPVTQGMDKAENALKSGFAQAMDVPGFNYRVHKYNKNLEQLPQGFLLGSETASTVSSRGIYKFPVAPDDNARYASYSKSYDPKAIKNADGQCSSYDVEYCPWSNLPDDDWRWQDDCPWVIGEFVWTGFDYLGEPSPYDEYWPSRSSYFGICDLAGLPKDRYFLYRSHWQKEQHTIHLLPHWSWGTSKRQKGNRIGLVTPVYCYTDYPEAELFVNGKSQGRIKKVKEKYGEWNPDNRLDRYRLRWNDVRYEPGELKVVVFDEAGKACGEEVIKTPGKPSRLQLDIWTQSSEKSQDPQSYKLSADGNDLAFVTVSLTDADGNLIPTADDRLTFEVEGAGQFRAACNGDATSLEPFTLPAMRLFSGQLVVVVQAARQPGQLVLRVSDADRKLSAETTIAVR